MLNEDELNEIENTGTSATKDRWSDMEVQYKTVLEFVEAEIQELKIKVSLIQASVAQASQTSAQVTSA